MTPPPLREHDGIILNEADWRARVAVLEVKHEHLSEKIDDMSSKVDEMYAALVGARGAKWLLIAGAMATGFLIGTLRDVGLFK